MPSPKDRIRIAAVSGADPRTVARYFRDPLACAELSRLAIKRALVEMGIPDPHSGAPS